MINKNYLILFLICLLLISYNAQPTLASSQVKPNTFASEIEKTLPAVVKVTGVNPQQENQTGAGVIIDSTGYIITSKHLVTPADNITINLKNKTKSQSATIIGSDSHWDIALLKINATELPTAQLGNSERLQTGDLVLAIGHPYDLNYSISLGIVSATNRFLKLNQENTTKTYQHLIQTDAAINPGNSGGPLLNTQGKVIGINTAINFKAQGISFAIPINQVQSSVQELKEHGKIIRPWLGIYLQQLTANLKDHLNFTRDYGALISNITPNSPAAKAGLKRGDILLQFNQQKIKQPQDLKNKLTKLNIGATITCTILRNNKTKTYTLQLKEQPDKKLQIAN
ncbi:S1C family serine protease [Halanaerobaculum tunisiense]